MFSSGHRLSVEEMEAHFVARAVEYVRRVEEFPGPVAVACEPPDGALVSCGYEDLDEHPWAMQVTYSVTSEDVLRVRTVRGSLDWTPIFGAFEDLAACMADFGRRAESSWPLELQQVAETATTMTIDGVVLPATRMDLPTHSGIRVEWEGQYIYCIGDPQLVDTVELRTGTGDDFAGFAAASAAFAIARRRTCD